MKKFFKIEYIVLFAFIVLQVTIGIFHEPWFDEAESWQIARCAGYKELIFSVPHYEGHPPLWHLLLSIPAKLGLPYEISLKTVGILFNSISVYLLLFKSPFKKWIRCLLPFTYFFFYQYGIVVRTYCVMILAIMLIMITFKDKDSHPFRFVLSIILLCFTTAFGLAIGAGLAIAWLIDIISEIGLKTFFKKLFSDKRILSLWLLLIGALFVVSLIMPKADTMATNAVVRNGIGLRSLYALFVAWADATMTDVLNGLLKLSAFDSISLLTASVLGIIIILSIILISKKKSIKYFLFMYFGIVVMIVSLYYNTHHEGILFFTLLLYFGLNRYISGESCAHLLFIKYPDISSIKIVIKIELFTFFAVSILWTCSASITDIRKPYSFGRDLATFISEHELESEYILTEWAEFPNGKEHGDLKYDTNQVDFIVDILPYYDSLNTSLNAAEPWRGYLVHHEGNDDNSQNILALKKKGIPGVILGAPNLSRIYGDTVSMSDYEKVYEIKYVDACIRKFNYFDQPDYMYVRKDLLESHNLESILPRKGQVQNE